MQNYIAYYRVSTNHQKNSGLGLESQRSTVTGFVRANNGIILDSFEDVESGSSSTRPSLLEALNKCKLTNATLVIAKLDRLSRNVAFLAQLMDSGVNFVCCDNPNANKLTIHILAAVAEEERRLISNRTKAALLQAKANGKKLGTNNLPKSDSQTAEHARKSLTVKAEKFKCEIKKVLLPVRNLSLRNQAHYLNSLNVKSARNSTWVATSIKRLYQ